MTGPILIWGAGAIGGSLGAAFVRAGRDAVFVDTVSAHVDAMNADGLTITGPVDPQRIAVRAFRPEDLHGTYEQIILAVKSHHTADALLALSGHLPANGVIISAQNGLEETRIARYVGAERTLGCFVNFGADYIEPGVVHYGGRGAVVLGELDGAMSARLQETLALFQLFEPRAVATPNIFGYLWAKLVYGAMLFGTALTNESIADVFDMHRYRPVFRALAHEVQRVAKAQGVTMEAFDGFDPAAFAPDAPVERSEHSFDAMAAHNRKSAKSHSGIWRDLAIRKRRTEVDAQLGPIRELGQRHGIATPLVGAIIARIHAIESGHSHQDIVWLDELQAIAAGARTP